MALTANGYNGDPNKFRSLGVTSSYDPSTINYSPYGSGAPQGGTTGYNPNLPIAPTTPGPITGLSGGGSSSTSSSSTSTSGNGLPGTGGSSTGTGAGGAGPTPGGGTVPESNPFAGLASSIGSSITSAAGGYGGGEGFKMPSMGITPSSLRQGLGQRLYPQESYILAGLQRAY